MMEFKFPKQFRSSALPFASIHVSQRWSLNLQFNQVSTLADQLGIISQTLRGPPGQPGRGVRGPAGDAGEPGLPGDASFP